MFDLYIHISKYIEHAMLLFTYDSKRGDFENSLKKFDTFVRVVRVSVCVVAQLGKRSQSSFILF